MCSSPKSNMSARAKQAPTKGILEELTIEQRHHFAEVANRADQQRQQRLATQRRYDEKHGNTTSKTKTVSFWRFLTGYLFS